LPIFDVHNSLQLAILGQQGGIDNILNAFAAWEFQRKAGLSGPLVLAIAGPTGVGKSEAGEIIALFWI
jgi:pantothenate kinase-related protein Tda10